ncbi:hypothetical protein [Antiquaquibacter soli]|uniref:TadE family protein n=1 Tax=Antiquaquibacter soli TaxID=3064523 RepID=A0ABT9BK65_9MICO|nr:hypothetical protein [Protaetiibacter sp. WY-16]MDO7881419.1 hypothetical protein [Protaetiibacter sp. WY-16]
MRRSSRWTDDSGSAAVEFVTAGLVLLVPLVYLVIAMSSIQAGALAAEGAARQAARVFVQATSVADARAAAERAVQFALADHGVESAETTVTISCRPSPDDCLQRRGLVTVEVSVAVPLPLMPPAITADIPLSVTLEAAATQQVSRFRDEG